jgi:hypothetical protein
MIIAQSNSAGTVIGSPQAYFTWYYRPVSFFNQKKKLFDIFIFVFEQKKDMLNFFFSLKQKKRFFVFFLLKYIFLPR